MKSTRLKMHEIFGYAGKYVLNNEDSNKVFYWYNPNNNKFIYVDNLEETMGRYDYSGYMEKGYIPVDQVDVLLLEQDFIKNLNSPETEELFQNLNGQEFYIAFNMFLEENIELSIKWHQIHMKTLINQMIRWLKKHNIKFSVNHALKRYLDE